MLFWRVAYSVLLSNIFVCVWRLMWCDRALLLQSQGRHQEASSSYLQSIHYRPNLAGKSIVPRFFSSLFPSAVPPSHSSSISPFLVFPYPPAFFQFINTWLHFVRRETIAFVWYIQLGAAITLNRQESKLTALYSTLMGKTLYAQTSHNRSRVFLTGRGHQQRRRKK